MPPALPPTSRLREPPCPPLSAGLRRAGALLAAILLAAGPSAAQTEAITAREGGEAGLVVLVEPADVALATELAAGGRHLVVALSADAARVGQWDAALAEAGVHPVANAFHWRDPTRLPFPTHKVNVLVLDAATAARLGEEEVRRAITPGHGFALVDDREIRKPRPEGMDQWLAYRRDATGNRASRDLLDPPNSIQWIGGMRGPGSGSIIITDRVFYHRQGGDDVYELIHGHATPRVRAAEAFSGVARWSTTRSLGHGGSKRWEFEIFTDGQRLFVPRSDSGARRGEPVDLGMMTLDLFTGETIDEYLPHIRWGARMTRGEMRTPGAFSYPGTMRIAGPGERIYQVDTDHTVRALSADGTELLWEKEFDPDEYTYQVASDGEIVVVLLTAHNDYSGGEGPGAGGAAILRRHLNRATALVGLDPATGRQRWRYEGVKDFPVLYLVADHGAVVASSHLYQLRQEEMAADNLLVSLDAATGREHFRRAGREGFQDAPNVAGRRGGLSVLGDRIVWLGSASMTIFEVRTGRVLEGSVDVLSPVGGTHTVYTSNTPRWLIGRDGNFVSYDGSVRDSTVPTVSKRDYAAFAKPANHMFYLQPGFLQGAGLDIVAGDMLAFAREEHVPDVLPDDRRLSVDGRAEGVREAEPADWPTFRGDFARRGWRPADGPANLENAWATRIDLAGPRGEIPLRWTLNSRRPGPLTAPVADGRRVLVALPDLHQVVCLDLVDGGVRWSTRLGGPMIAPPTLAGDVAFVGAYDGTVTALNLEDGAVIWTFLAAPYERYINAHQQMESSHPVVSSPVLLDGTLYVSAGRHSHVDHGVFVWALDPGTGEIRARQTLSGDRIRAGNALLQVVGDQVRISRVALDAGTLEIVEANDAPFVFPHGAGHHGGMGWIGPAHLWSGMRMVGREGRQDLGSSPVILTDDHFAVFQDAGHSRRPVLYREFSPERFERGTEPTREVEMQRGDYGLRDLYVKFAGAGRYRYAASRRNRDLAVAVWDAAEATPEWSLATIDLLNNRETIIPDGIAIAHGHVIITTTEGRVLAFRAAE